MALLETICCRRCGLSKQVNVSPGEYRDLCDECEADVETGVADAYVLDLRGLTLEQRVERLERLEFNRSLQRPWDGRIG